MSGSRDVKTVSTMRKIEMIKEGLKRKVLLPGVLRKPPPYITALHNRRRPGLLLLTGKFTLGETR